VILHLEVVHLQRQPRSRDLEFQDLLSDSSGR
jgi:hypothetical protein